MRMGMDKAYLKERLGRVLSRITNYTGPEFGRELVRMALVANPDALKESEFAPNSSRSEELKLLQRLVDFDAGKDDNYQDIVVSAKSLLEKQKPVPSGRPLSCCR
ncbi:hypothetical protein [Ralstonia phage RP13]|nr:hypothetical protein [Ralstonia phage RP13]